MHVIIVHKRKVVMTIQSLALAIETYVRQRLPRYIEELHILCAINSNSYCKPGLDAMADYLAVRLRTIGMNVTTIEHDVWGNDLVGVAHGEGKGDVVLIGHTDTVYPVHLEPSPLRIEDGMIYGPGVCDMKGCILSAVYAIEALLTIGYRSFRTIRLVCVSDEEIVDRHSKQILRQACSGCHGALVLEAARPNGDIISARKGTMWYTLTANGRAAHAGNEPEKGLNAILELSHQILQFQRLNGWREGITINPGVIHGGTTPNVVPDHASVRLDLRFLNPQDRLDTETQWRVMMQNQLIPGVALTLEADPAIKEPMIQTEKGTKLALQAQEIANLLGFSINHVLAGGSSDAAIPSLGGIPTLDGLGPIGGSDHSPGEYLVVSSVAPRTALLAGLIVAIGTSPFS